MRSYQFRDFLSAWSDRKPVVIDILAQIQGVYVDLRPLTIQYSNNRPELTFNATISWDAVELTYPITIHHYEVWVATTKAGVLGTTDASVSDL